MDDRERAEQPESRYRYTQAQIERRLTKYMQDAAISQGLRVADAWSDWLCITEVTLRMTPVHAKSVSEHGTLAQDPPEIAAEWARIKARYGDGFQHLEAAYGDLLHCIQPIAGIEPEIRDVLGPLHMAIGNANIKLGQFFTPWELSLVAAQSTMEGAAALVYQRMEQAIRSNPMLAMITPKTEGWINADNARSIAESLLPIVWERYDTVTIHDPSCGSGGMLLAAASILPRWMVAMGLVAFYGQDLSRDCTRMTQINMMLFGLNGWGLRFTTAMAHLRESPLAKRFREEVPPTAPEPMIASVSVGHTDTMYPDIEIGAQGALFNLH